MFILRKISCTLITPRCGAQLRAGNQELKWVSIASAIYRGPLIWLASAARVAYHCRDRRDETQRSDALSRTERGRERERERGTRSCHYRYSIYSGVRLRYKVQRLVIRRVSRGTISRGRVARAAREEARARAMYYVKLDDGTSNLPICPQVTFSY